MSASPRMRRIALLVLFTLLGATGLSALATGTADATLTRAARVSEAFQIAKNQIGDPYRYGADGPGAFDCSGLTYFALKKRSGFTNLPRTSSGQARFAHRIAKNSLRKGDFMFFYDGGGVYHVGMFAGWRDGRRLVLHSPYTGSRVHIEKVWTSRWFAGTLR